MFYSHLVLTKKGQLGRLWFAATLGEAKIPKQFAYEARIDILCRSIEQPAAPFALRLSAHLMLGVARVFSRKSSIVLSDVNNVLAAIRRHQRQDVESTTTGKRRRRSSDLSGASGAVTGSARMDRITLPVSKARKKSGEKSGVMTGPEFFLTQEAPLDQYGRSLENPLGIGGANLEMEFPTGNLGSMLDGHNLGAKMQGSMSFQAKEEDITLLPGSDLGLLSDVQPEVGVGSMDANLSLTFSNPPTLSPGNLADPPNIAEAQQEFKEAFAGPERQSSARDTPVSVLDMEVMEPLQMTSPGRKQGQSPHNKSPKGKSPKGPPSPTGIQKPGRRSSTETATTKRSKRALRMLKNPSTEETELTTNHIRECINDTSDIVIPLGASRPSRKRGKKVPKDLASLLLAYNPLSKIHGSLWQDLVVKPSMGIEQGTDESSPDNMAAADVDPATGKTPTPPLGDQELDVLPPMDLDNFMLGESAAPQQQAGSVAGSDARQPSGASGPSVSQGSGAMSIPKSSSEGRKSPEALRDQALEGITEADRAAYNSARRMSGPFNFETPTQQATQQAPPMKDAFQSGSSVDAAPTARSHPTSESGGSIEIATQKVDDAELFPIRDSDIQLVEQTEPDDSAAAAMGRLNIRAFKILGILRERAKSMGNVDASSTEQVATFNELVRDCSRGATARTFLHLTALTTMGFIRVVQNKSFDNIAIFPGRYF